MHSEAIQRLCEVFGWQDLLECFLVQVHACSSSKILLEHLPSVGSGFSSVSYC